MKVLSLFDGIGGARQALKELSIDCQYYASEIDKYAIQVAKTNHPDIIPIGDVKGIGLEDGWIFHNQNNDPIKNGGSFKGDIDLLVGGSPCQDLSIAKKGRKGLDGDRSSLFYEYLRILNEVKPNYFILENVASMSKASKEIITKELFGIEPAMINSSLLTAQNRKRYYWVGKLVDGKYQQVKIDQPEDQKIYLKDIIEDGIAYQEKSYSLTASYDGAVFWNSIIKKQRTMVPIPVVFDKVKYETIKKSYQKRVNKISSEFNKYLKEAKSNFTYKDIAIKLDLPLSQVEHYFRTDKSRAIPSIENYKKIKKLLNLNNEWDNLIADFEIKQSTYEQNLRLYNINGKSPTLTLNCNIPIKLGCINKGDRIYSVKGKSICLSANGGGKGSKTGLYKIDLPDGEYIVRKLTPTECCRLQGFSDKYVSMVSNTQSYKALGNSFTVPIIKHILTNLINENS